MTGTNLKANCAYFESRICCCKRRLYTFNGICAYANKKYNAEFVVVKGDYQQMNLVTVQQDNIQQVTMNTASLTLDQLKEEFGDVFKGQGCMEGKLHLEIDKTVTPVINPPRRVPFALKAKLKSELDRLEGLEMIREVKEPTDWVSSLVVWLKSPMEN